VKFEVIFGKVLKRGSRRNEYRYFKLVEIYRVICYWVFAQMLIQSIESSFEPKLEYQYRSINTCDVSRLALTYVFVT